MRSLWYTSLFSTRLYFSDLSLSKISGGTGFAPFHQLLFRHLQGKVAPSTRVTLLHASRSPAELPPLPLLQPLINRAVTHPEYFQLKLFVDGTPKTPAPESVVKHLKVGRIDKSTIAHTLGINMPDDAWSWSSWISNLWTMGQPRADEIDVRKKNVLVLVCGPEPYVH